MPFTGTGQYYGGTQIDVMGNFMKGAEAREKRDENKLKRKGREDAATLQELYNTSMKSGDSDAVFMKKATEKGLASQGAQYLDAMTKLKDNSVAMQQVKGAIAWALMEKDPSERKKRIGYINKIGEGELGIPKDKLIPEDADDSVLGSYLGVGDSLKVINERYYKDVLAQARKQEAEAKKTTADKKASGKGTDKSPTQAQIISWKASKSRLEAMTDDEKEEMRVVNSTAYEKLEKESQMYSEYEAGIGSKKTGVGKKNRFTIKSVKPTN